MYYALFPSRMRERKDWWVVCKVKSRAIHYKLEEEEEELYLSEYFQEDEILGVHQYLIDIESDAPTWWPIEIDHTEFVFREHPIQKNEEEEEVKEVKEEKEEEESKEEYEGYEISEEEDE